MSDTNPVAAFNAAYAAAQFKCENPALDSVNPAYKSRFASLASTRNEVVPTFAEVGIAIQQTPCTPQVIGDRLYAGVRTVLRHKDGHVEDLGDCLMPVQKIDAQGIASCLTYAKRQSLQALAGVTGEMDDDANEATGKPAQAQQLKPGIGIHSPLGDVDVCDQDRLYASLFINAVKTTDNVRIHQLHGDLHTEGEERYRAVWSLLDSKVRSHVKKVLAEKEIAA
jgi:hypothetical protein